MKLALERYEKAWSLRSVDFVSVERRLGILDQFANPSSNGLTAERGDISDLGVPLQLPSKLECYEQIMQLLHDLHIT